MKEEALLLSKLLIKQQFDSYYTEIAPFLSTEGRRIAALMAEYYTVTDKIDDSIYAWLTYSKFGEKKDDVHTAFEQLLSFSADEAVVGEVFTSLKKRRILEEMQCKAIDVLEGNATFDAAAQWWEDKTQGLAKGDTTLDKYCLALTKEQILKKKSDEVRYAWRLPVLQQTTDGVPVRTFITVSGGTDAGKTSFVLNESLHLIRQFPEGKKIIFVNNEEDSTKIFDRAYQIAEAQAGRPVSNLSHRLEVWDKEDWKVSELSQLFTKRANDIGIIIFNTLDDIQGYGEGAYDVNGLQRLSQWGRRKAIELGAIAFNTSQISWEYAQNKVIYNTALAGSRTGKASKSDVTIQIGWEKDSINESTRYITIDKNKLSPYKCYGQRVELLETGEFI